MNSLPSNIPSLKRTLDVFSQGLESLELEQQRIKQSISACADVVPDEIISDVLNHLSQKFDNSFMHRAINDVETRMSALELELLDKSRDEYAKKDRSWFVKNLNDMPNESIYDKESLDYLKMRISNFNDYTHNGLEIGCGLGYWYQWLAALSPLYQADINWGFFTKIAEQFRPLFFKADRMRFVKTTGTDLPEVNDNIIDFVFSWNTFNFLPVEQIESYLRSIMRVMKPGGYAIIGYTNAYLDDAYQQVIDGHWAYNNSDYMAHLVSSAGFEPRAIFNANQKGSWIEFVKPGTKIHQVGYPKPGTGYCKKIF